MSTRTEVWIGVAGIVGIVLVLWVVVAFANYQHDAPARVYSETQSVAVPTATSTNPVVVVADSSQKQSDSFWPYFFWGYMMGLWGPNSYSVQRQTINNTYYNSPAYQEAQAVQEAQWAQEESSWGSGWSSSNSGSWGSDDDSWGSSDSGSWGSSSYDSYDSGSWGGNDSWSSSDSGSWGD